MRWSCVSIRSICRRAAARCWLSSSTASAPASRRWSRFTIAVTISRSRISSAAAPGGAFSCLCVLKNSAGSLRMRLRIAADPRRHAAYSCPAARVSQRCSAKIAAMRWQSSRLCRATGTRNFMASCAAISPSRTCCWMTSGKSSTSASRRDTQLTLRSNRRASSSRL